MKKVFTLSSTAFLLAFSFVANTSQALVIDSTEAPAAATDVLVTGSDAPANGPVELLVNGVSAGSVQANGSGFWSITANIKADDLLTAQVAQVWNFDNDGDAEGWYSSQGVIDVSGGVLTVTRGSDSELWGMDILLDTGGTIIMPSLPVLEIGYRTNASNVTTPGVTRSMAVDTEEEGVETYGPFWRPTTGTSGFVADVIDMTINNPDYTVNAGVVSGGPAYQIGVAYGGINPGETFEIDFIRMRETLRMGFQYDGDVKYEVNADCTLGVPANGRMVMNATPNTGPKIKPVATGGVRKDGNIEWNPKVFTHFAYRGAVVSENSGQVINMFYNTNGGDGASFVQFNAPILTSFAPADFGIDKRYVVDMSTDANWSDNGTCHLINQWTWISPMWASDSSAEESIDFDYIEWAPAAISDSEYCIVGLPTSVFDWTLMK